MAPALLCKLFPRSLSRSSRDAGAGTASRGCCGGSHPTRLCKEKTLWCSPADRWGAKVGGPITQGCYECNSQLLKSIYPPPFFLHHATDATVPWVCNPPPLPRDQSLPRSGLCTAPPPPSRAARSHHHRRHRHQQHGAAPATGPPPLKGRWPLLKGPSRARPAGARRPGSRRAAPSLGRAPRGVQSAGPCRRHREQHFYSGDA